MWSRMTLIPLISFVFLHLLLFSLSSARTFLKASKVVEIAELLGISTEEAAQTVTSALSTCELSSPLQVRGLGECQGRCLLDDRCVALTYSRDGECIFCTASDRTSVSDSLLGFSRSQVMVAVALPDMCASYPCANLGLCVYSIRGYRCSCLLGFTGVNCEGDSLSHYKSNIS